MASILNTWWSSLLFIDSTTSLFVARKLRRDFKGSTHYICFFINFFGGESCTREKNLPSRNNHSLLLQFSQRNSPNFGHLVNNIKIAFNEIAMELGEGNIVPEKIPRRIIPSERISFCVMFIFENFKQKGKFLISI